MTCRGRSHPHHSSQLPQTETDLLSISNRSMFSTLLLQQEEGGASPPSNHSANERRLQLSQWEAPTLPTPNFLQWTLQQPFWTPTPFIYKRTFLSFVLWTCQWFAIGPHVPSYNSLLFPNELFLAEKYWVICLRSTNPWNVVRQTQQFFKWPTDLNRCFTKADTQMAYKHMKRCTKSLVIKEVHIQITMRYSDTFIRMVAIKNRLYQVLIRTWGTGTHTLHTHECVKWYNHFRKQFGSSFKNQTYTYHMIQPFHS